MRWVLIVIMCVGVALLAFGNPHSLAWPLKCPLYWTTGWQCPLCGMQRATHELLCGNISEAWHLNPAYLLSLPYLGCLLAGQLSSRVYAMPLIAWCYRDRQILMYMALMAVWGVVRNVI